MFPTGLSTRLTLEAQRRIRCRPNGRIVLVYRHRWTGIETFHQDGKQPWGLGDCQVRSGAEQTCHMSLVSAASSLLLRALQPRHAQERARWTLTPIGEPCRAVNADTLARMSDGVVDTLAVVYASVTKIKAVLACDSLCTTSVLSQVP